MTSTILTLAIECVPRGELTSICGEGRNVRPKRWSGTFLCGWDRKHLFLRFALENLLMWYNLQVEAIGTLHACGVIHENLGPDSVLVGMDGHILITGFEKSTVAGVEPYTQNMTSVVPLSAWRAPEAILGWPHDCSVDWWGLGMVIWFMLSGWVGFTSLSSQMVKWRNRPGWSPHLKHPFLPTMNKQQIERIHPTIVESCILYGELIPNVALPTGSAIWDLVSNVKLRHTDLITIF